MEYVTHLEKAVVEGTIVPLLWNICFTNWPFRSMVKRSLFFLLKLMAVGSGGAKHGLYQPGVMPVLHGAIQIPRMCPLWDRFVDAAWEQRNSALVVLSAGMHDTYLQNVFRMQGVLETSVVSYLVDQLCLKLISGHFLNLQTRSTFARSVKATWAWELGAGGALCKPSGLQAGSADGSQQAPSSVALV